MCCSAKKHAWAKGVLDCAIGLDPRYFMTFKLGGGYELKLCFRLPAEGDNEVYYGVAAKVPADMPDSVYGRAVAWERYLAARLALRKGALWGTLELDNMDMPPSKHQQRHMLAQAICRRLMQEEKLPPKLRTEIGKAMSLYANPIVR